MNCPRRRKRERRKVVKREESPIQQAVIKQKQRRKGSDIYLLKQSNSEETCVFQNIWPHFFYLLDYVTRRSEKLDFQKK